MQFELDLFREEKPKGLDYFPEFISEEEELFLLSEISDLPYEEFRFHGYVARRRVVHFGYRYYFETRNFSAAEEIPAFLKPLTSRVARALAVPNGEIAEVLITHYPKGAPIGWHRDAPMFEDLFGLSLGNACTMKFRHRRDHSKQYKLVLEPRSGYRVKGIARWDWEHHIPPVKVERYSITFRTLCTSPILPHLGMKNLRE